MSEIAELPKSKKVKGGTLVSKITINSKRFLSACSIVSKVISSKPIVPAVANILVQVEGDSLRLTATDTKQIVVTKLYFGELGNKSHFSFPAGPGVKLLQNLPDAPVEISHITSETKGGEVIKIVHNIEISCNGNYYSFETDAPIDFPIGPNLSEIDPVTLPSDAISKGILFCKDFTSTDTLMPALNGIYFEVRPDVIKMHGADMHSISKFEFKHQSEIEENLSFVVPSKAASLLSELNSGDIELRLSGNGAQFSDKATSVFFLLIEEKYPEIDNAFPKTSSIEAVAEINAFKSALNRISIISGIGQTRMVLSDSLMKIETNDTNFGNNGEEEFTLNEYKGDEYYVGFNPSLVMRSLSKISSGTVTIKGTTPDRQFTMIASAEPDFEFLVMPVTWNHLT